MITLLNLVKIIGGALFVAITTYLIVAIPGLVSDQASTVVLHQSNEARP